jgi:rhamnosyltransferase
LIPIRVDWVSGAVMLLRASAVAEIHGFDPAFFLYGEDVDLGIRLNRAGWDLWIDPSVIAGHKVGASQPIDSSRWVDGTLEVVRRESGPITERVAAAMMAAGLGGRAMLTALRIDRSHDERHLRAMRAAASRAFKHALGRPRPISGAHAITTTTNGDDAVLPATPEPSRDTTAAVFVSHEPSQAFAATLRRAAGEAGAVVIVDNGSRAPTAMSLQRLARDLPAATIFNESNAGLGHALNQGMTWAAENGFAWALLLDQDASPHRGLLNAAARAFRDAGEAPVALISAAKDARRCVDSTHAAEEAVAAITAGSFHNVAAWRRLGGFRADFFTDYVDIEYCLRAREAGYSVLRLCRPAIDHEIGHPTRHRLGWRRVTTTNHDRHRRYYITRNRVLVWRRYGRREATYILGDMRAFAKECVKLALFEQDRLRKGAAIARGLAHGVRGATGQIATK